ncbi:MAG: molybdenum cofactor guanylyltransferase [Polyangiaceae bacterium]|nr:molybdenum cofactor guanylyltransferase [Polyangiaceae bacterium]
MGRPKAWLPFGGETLLQRTVRRVGEAAWPIVVVAAPEQELPPLPSDIRIVRDPVEGRGPLQGIAVGLGALEGVCDAAFVSSTDAPFVEPALIRRLAALRAGGFDIAVPRAGGHHHPLCAVYGCSVRAEADALLAAGRPRPFFLFERVRTLIAEAPLLLEDPILAAVDPVLRSLCNLNTPDDYEAALREAGISRP